MCYKKISLTLATALMIIGPANAATTVTYNFDLDQETQNATILGSDVDISASSLTFVGYGAYSAADSGTWWIENTNPVDATNYLRIASSVADTGDYIEFSISANTAGFTLTGASLQHRMERNFDGNLNANLRSSLDGYTADLISASNNRDTWGTTSNTSITGVADQTSTTFRLYVDVSKRSAYFDNLTLTLEPSAIPEPSSALLLFGGVSALFGLRRKR
jgi:hypothetical protein